MPDPISDIVRVTGIISDVHAPHRATPLRVAILTGDTPGCTLAVTDDGDGRALRIGDTYRVTATRVDGAGPPVGA